MLALDDSVRTELNEILTGKGPFAPPPDPVVFQADEDFVLLAKAVVLLGEHVHELRMTEVKRGVAELAATPG